MELTGIDFSQGMIDRGRKLFPYLKLEVKESAQIELPEGAVLRHHSEDWIHELLSDFRGVKYERLTFTTMNGHTSNGFYYLGEKV